MHSLNFPECKAEGTVSLYEAGDDCVTAIHVAIDVIGAGFNARGFTQFIRFPSPLSASSML